MNKYKVCYKTVLDYWKNKRFKAETVEAASAVDAEFIVSDRFSRSSDSPLSKQIYEIKVTPLNH